MANCHPLLIQFNGDLQITETKRKSLQKSKDALRKVIVKWFKENQPEYVPEFFIQGSYKMKTLIRTKENTCDLDDGIHFTCEPKHLPDQLKAWVYEAVKDHTDGGPQNKSKCVRVIYKNDYHIDLPVYKHAEDDSYPWLAVNGKEWGDEESDPKGFVEWYQDNKTEQMTRIVRYLKAWGDHVRNDMLSGLAMTLLSQKYLQSDERDDVALRDTLKSINEALKISWSLIMPVKPGDDVIAHHDDVFQKKFFERLDAFIEDADTALKESAKLKASKLWRKHLGQRFPLGEDSKDESKSNLSALHGMAAAGSYKPYGNG